MNAQETKDALDLDRCDVEPQHIKNMPPMRWLAEDGGTRMGVMVLAPGPNGDMYGIAYDPLRGEFQKFGTTQWEPNVAKDINGNPIERKA
jgi:hypothetical protein